MQSQLLIFLLPSAMTTPEANAIVCVKMRIKRSDSVLQPLPKVDAAQELKESKVLFGLNGAVNVSGWSWC